MKLYTRYISLIISFFLLVFFANCAQTNYEGKETNKTENNDIELIDKYRIEVAQKVQKKWKLNDNCKCIDDDEVKLVFRVLPNGSVDGIMFAAHSKCKDLDKSAYLAIKNAGPFMPFPKDIIAPYIEVGIRFLPMAQ